MASRRAGRRTAARARATAAAAALAGCVGLLAAWAPPAAARDVEEVIPGLYGGDGITLGNPGHDAHFTADTFEKLALINAALAEIPGNLPIGSSAASVTYELDPATGTFERRVAEGLGPLYAERARTLGGNLFEGVLRLSLAFQYSFVDFEQFEGDDLDSLRIVARHDDEPGDNAFENDVIVIDLDIAARMHLYNFYGTLGIAPWLDLAVVVPLVDLKVKADARARIVDRGGAGIHFFDPTPGRVITPGGRPTDAPTSRGEERAFGFGDTVLRAKFRFLDLFKAEDGKVPLEDKMEFALVGQVKFPTGDEDELLGTGDTDWRLLLVASKTFDGWFEPHFNFGYEWNGTTSRRDAWIWAAGAAVKVADEVTLFADAIGKKKRRGEDIGDNIVDAAVGAKLNPFGNLIVTPAALIPLNEEGLRADWIPSIALEYIF